MTSVTGGQEVAALEPSPRRPSRRRLVVLALVAVVGIGTSLFLWTAGRVWWVARQDSRPPSDAIVVLGASQFDGRPSSWFAARLTHALDIYEAGVAPRIITVGGNQPGDRFTEASAGRSWLLDHGVDADAVIALGVGANTLDSMRAVDELYEDQGWRSAVIVTDPWHSLRARTMARDLGIDAETSPTRQGPAVRERSTEIHQILRETAALWTYRLFSR